jgi:hypothetical protein
LGTAERKEGEEEDGSNKNIVDEEMAKREDKEEEAYCFGNACPWTRCRRRVLGVEKRLEQSETKHANCRICVMSEII